MRVARCARLSPVRVAPSPPLAKGVLQGAAQPRIVAPHHAHVFPKQRPVATDEIAPGYAGRRKPRRDRVLCVTPHAVRHARCSHEGSHRRPVAARVDVYSHHLEASRLVPPIEPVEQRNLGATGRTPDGPDVQQHRAAPQSAERHGIAVEGDGAIFRNLPSEHGRAGLRVAALRAEQQQRDRHGSKESAPRLRPHAFSPSRRDSRRRCSRRRAAGLAVVLAEFQVHLQDVHHRDTGQAAER